MSTLLNARNGCPSYLGLSSVGSSGTFTNIAGLTKIGDFAVSKKTISLDTHATTDGYDQVILGGVTATKAIQFTGIYLSTDTYHSALIPQLLDASQRVGWKITIAGTSSNNIMYGDGFITDYSVSLPYEDKVTFSFTLKPTGKPTGWASSTT